MSRVLVLAVQLYQVTASLSLHLPVLTLGQIDVASWLLGSSIMGLDRKMDGKL